MLRLLLLTNTMMQARLRAQDYNRIINIFKKISQVMIKALIVDDEQKAEVYWNIILPIFIRRLLKSGGRILQMRLKQF